MDLSFKTDETVMKSGYKYTFIHAYTMVITLLVGLGSDRNLRLLRLQKPKHPLSQSSLPRRTL